MPAGTIADPTKARAHTIIDAPDLIATAYQAWLQNESAGTLIHSVTTPSI